MQDGSSPRVRGKLARSPLIHLRQRIIPASAGQTPSVALIITASADHPRECGANVSLYPRIVATSGSSPRVRGKPLASASAMSYWRIIPASAGQTRCSVGHQRRCPDHPRECGANTRPAPVILMPVGSSPRVRGKLGGGGRVERLPRIIPASAGQTIGGGLPLRLPPDHPRECGANSCIAVSGRRGRGSSPRVRGKRPMPMGGLGPRRIIPASAGQTGWHVDFGAQEADHPRECGANSGCRPTLTPRTGSSPRVRGKRTATFADCNWKRIIPASAGQTCHKR